MKKRERVSPELVALQAEWLKYFKVPPPRRASREFLAKNISWQKQAKEEGVNLNKFYKTMESGLAKYEVGKKDKPELIVKSGTKFIRQWHGRAHEVEVVGSAFSYNGGSYRSLSAIARKITGTQWNGKLFFGVKK